MVSVSEIVILMVLIVLSGFFSGAETALVAISRFKVKLFDQKNKKGSHYLMDLKSKPHRMLATLLICNNVVNIGASAFATNLALNIFKSNGVAYATGIMTFVILVFGEIVPKNLATTHASKISLFVAPIIYYLRKILFPLIIIFDFISSKLFRLKHEKQRITEEEIRNIVDIAKEEGEIDKDEKEMIHKIFKFDDIDVDEIKIPRTDMIAIDIKSNLRDALDLIKKKQHSRFPVYEGSKDKIKGIFYFKDALDHIRNKELDTKISNLMRSPLVIPESKKLDETLRLFQKKNHHMAIIIDEHGGVSGLITIEDILEEIVGEITDETEKVEPEISKIDKKSFRILGKADIEEVNKQAGTKFSVTEDYDTFSGYILNEIGRIPKSGEIIKIENYILEIKRVEENRILEVIFKKDL